MSTRGTIGFRINGKDKLTYNHSDSYPSWLGLEVLKFLRTADLDTLKKQAGKLKFIPKNRKPTAADIAVCQNAGTVNLGVSERSTSDWYCLTREAQGNLAKTLEIGFMSNGNDFLFDSIFCEWAYIINLDTGTLEVYEGFNEGQRVPGGGIGQTDVGTWKPKFPNGRYANDMSDPDNTSRIARGEEPYFGVHLVAEFRLDKLPTDKTFLKKTESVRS